MMDANDLSQLAKIDDPWADAPVLPTVDDADRSTDDRLILRTDSVDLYTSKTRICFWLVESVIRIAS